MEEPKFDITTFKKAISDMIVKSGKSWNEYSNRYNTFKIREYTKEEIEKIINNGNIEALQKLSRNFFYKDGLYKRILIYYATILQYAGLLIPNPISDKLSTPHIKKRYENALDYIEKMFLPELLTRISLRTLIDGCYYGVAKEITKTDFTLIDLPAEYCRSNYKDLHGNDIIEFRVTYFDQINDEKVLKQVLNIYPKVIADHYRRYKKGQVKSEWVKVPTDIGFCFSLTEDGRPFFLDLILAVVDYDEAKDINRERDLEEIRKIIVQKVPHISDGTLLFDPPEAAEMHRGAVDMMRGNRNISVLTTYADVDSVVSKTSSEATTNSLEKNLQNVYVTGSVSGQLFAPTGSQALSTSITNDMSLMMILANKYSRFLTYVINFLFANSNINFKYMILPLSWYNVDQFITNSLKLAQSGYSFLLPGIASGISQKDLINIKNMENDYLDLPSVLIPLSSSYTQGTEEVGRPKLSVDEKSPKTLQNEESINNQ